MGKNYEIFLKIHKLLIMICIDILKRWDYNSKC